MAQGIKLPIKIVDGRWSLSSGDAYIQQIVMGALLGNESDNPFYDIGLGEWMIFNINDETTEADIRNSVIGIFDILEQDQLAKIDNIQDDLNFRSVGADLYMDLTYRNMETQERAELEVPIPGGGE